MARIPSGTDSTAAAYARFSSEYWGEMDGWYHSWIRKWRRTIEFIRGEHWNLPRSLLPNQIPSWKRFPVVNFTLALYVDYLTQWLQSSVRYSAVPDSPDPEEVSGAELADHLLRYLWDVQQMESKRVDLAAWLGATGNGDIRVYWDTNTGNMAPLALPGPDGALIPINPETLQPDPSMPEPVMVDEGEINVEIVPPQFVRWSTDKAKGVMVGLMMTYDEAVNQYGKEIAELLAFSSKHTALTTDMLQLSLSEPLIQKEERALIIEHYLPRSSRFPNGHWWIANERRLIKDPNELPGGHIPIVHFRWAPHPGHPYFGITPLHDQTFLNKLYDKMMARSEEWADRIVPKWLLKQGGGLRIGDLTNEPGQELEVAEGGAPEAMALPDPPRLWEDLRQTSRSDLALVGGYEFIRPEAPLSGQATQRVRKPGRMANQGGPAALPLILSKGSWERLGYVLLGYVGSFYTESRAITVVGSDRTFQWKEFSGEDVKNLRARIRVDETPLYPWSRQDLRDSVVALLQTQAGAILFSDSTGQQLDKNKVESAVEAMGIDSSLKLQDPDVLEARNELSMISNIQEGQQEGLAVQSWQNSAVHVEEKSRFLKSMQFRAWPPHRQQALIQNVEAHQQRLQEAQEAQQQSVIEQEKQLRDIRAQSEVSEQVKVKLAEEIIEVLAGLFSKAVNVDTDNKKEE